MPIPSPDTHQAERRSLAQIAVETIRAAIVSGTLRPGEHLRDKRLQEWLSMSRTPVREAIIELTRLGLVEMQPHRFTRVALVGDASTVLYDLQTIGALLCGLVRVTVPTLTESAADEVLAGINRALGALKTNPHAHKLADLVDAAVRLRKYCPNPILLAATSDLIDAKLHRIAIADLLEPANRERLAAHYQDLYNAISVKDTVATELAIEGIFLLDRRLPQD